MCKLYVHVKNYDRKPQLASKRTQKIVFLYVIYYYLLLPVVHEVPLLLDGVEEGVGESVLGGDALVRVEVQHRGQ